MPESTDETNRRITLETGVFALTATVAPQVFLTSTFAPEWFADALREARVEDPNSRRREIVFAACSAESYIVEWARDVLMKWRQGRDMHLLEVAFPEDGRRGVLEKWPELMKLIHREGLSVATQDLSGSTWQDFTKLIHLRNGLIHARASIPKTDSLPAMKTPYPTRSDLDSTPPGWPTRVVVAVIKSLHTAAGSDPPNWLSSP